MIGEPDLIALLYRADWTRLSLSAEVNDGSTLLVAPGKRYRMQTGEHVEGCDGDRPWELRQRTMTEGTAREVHMYGGPEPPLRPLLCPAWLLTGSRLEVRGRMSACGRDALHVVATRRPSIRSSRGLIRLPDGGAEVIVDAELGILLSLAWLADGQAADVTALVRLELDPVTDPELFSPPAGSLVAEESFDEFLGPLGPVVGAVKTAAGVAAGGLGAWIRYSPIGHRQPTTDPGDAETAIPRDDPAPERAPDGRPAGPPVSDAVLHMLQERGTGEFAATLHQWYDYGAMLSQLPAGARRTGFGGLGLLADAVSGRQPTAHLVSTVRIGGPGKYQIDHAYDLRRGPKTIACDGQRRWQVYADRVVVGPAGPPPSNIADLADASWLLGCWLSGGAPVMAGGRPAHVINVARGRADWAFSLMFPTAVAVVDAELGILLRLTSYLGGKPVQRCELRDVTAGAGDFRATIPPDLPTVEETRRTDGGPPPPVNLPVKVASVVAQQLAQEATKAARKLLRRFDPR